MTTQFRRSYRRLFATTILLGGTLAAPAFADGTNAGTSISNTAVSTYEDVNAPGTTINSASNTVVVQVAEVAGITVTASGTSIRTDANNDGKVNAGDSLYYTYTVTNVGNDPTSFRIPNLATVTGPGVASTLEVSYDGGTTWTPINGAEVITTSVPVAGSVMVRVPVTVQPGAQTNDVINVTLGNTPGDAQNQLRSPDGGDVYTVDNLDTAGAPEVPGAPVNGVREASVTQRVTIDSTLKNYALATVLKARTAYDNKGTAAITGDTVSYGLSLRVESTDPTGNAITPAPLVGTNISLDGIPTPRILVSDAIPAGTELSTAPTPPTGWQAVYTTDPVTGAGARTANTAAWKTFPLKAGDTLAGVTRVGFVNNPATITSVAPGATVSGFNLELRVTSTATNLTVANIAQLFGQTPGTNAPVYDESGDNLPSNFNDNGTPLTGMDTNADGVPDALPPAVVDDGYINTPVTPETGTDTSNNNTGTGPSGEANLFTITAPVAGALQNGPQSAPDAIGPTSNNDDFTNKTSLVPAGTLPGSLIDPASVAFTNTVQNSGTAANPISLIPVPPANPADLPTNSVVTITYGAQSRTYVWDGTAFRFDGDGNPGTTADQSPIDATSEYITIPSVAPGVSVNYGVEVNLPPATPLSTDTGKGFPVPVLAFIDDATPGYGGNPATEAGNTTIDRVYTGFLKMVKESRVLPGTGPAVQGTDGTYSVGPKKPAPGNILEYRITYSNISDAQAGTGNVVLNATKVVVTEDGTSGGNNWALDNDANGQIDTSNVVGSAKDSGASTITFWSGNPTNTAAIDQSGTTATTDVTKYIDTVTGNVAPGISRTFGFQRKVN
jgi:hypothetical protein